MSFEIKTLLAIASPALIASLFLIVSRLGGRSGRWGAAVGSAIGYAAGQWILLGWPGFPPVDVTLSPIFFVFIAAILGVEDAVWLRMPPLIRWLTRAALIWCMVSVLLVPLRNNVWSPTESRNWILGLGFLSVVVLGHLAAVSEKIPAPVSSSALFLPIVALIPLMIFSHSAVLGQMAIISASAVFPAVALAWWSRDPAPIRGVLLVAFTLEGSLLLSGYFYGDGLTLLGVFSVLLAPLLAWLGAFRPMKTWRPRLLGLAIAILLTIPLGIAIGLAAKAYIAGLKEEMEVQQTPRLGGSVAHHRREFEERLSAMA